jgi:Na+-translocating ferredoxin:NAD+ oxidoreductase RnfC subunit
MISVEEIKDCGIVGAGGAGFPSYVKLSSQVEIFIVNAAECEPLLHKDKEILSQKTEVFLKGLKDCIRLVGAKRCIIGIKGKHKNLIKYLESCCDDYIEIFPLGDYYPAGDEILLTYETTGRVVKAGALPISQNVLIHNVETIFNIGKQEPVTTKFITVAGDVKTPVSLEVPIGISFREAIEVAVPNPKEFGVIVGGPMMGCLVDSLEQPVTKTTGALLVFPTDHILIQRYATANSVKKVAAIGRSACDQCSMCTELCPRNLIGHPIQPHKAMRMLSFPVDLPETRAMASHTIFCCECNLCSLVSCPEDLYPAQTCINYKRAVMKEKVPYNGEAHNKPHELINYRKTPIKKIMAKLDLAKFKNYAPLVDFAPCPEQLKVMLTQHIGASAKPLVQTGDRVTARQKIGTVGNNLGAEIHSPMDGSVMEVTERYIVIKT